MNIIDYNLIRILCTIIFGLIILSILLIIKKICPKVLKKRTTLYSNCHYSLIFYL